MKDVQNERDGRNIDLDNVGVKNVMIPLTLKDKKYRTQQVQATVQATVSLNSKQKGVHMSHLIDPLFKLSKGYGLNDLVKIAKEIQAIQNKENKDVVTDSCKLIIDFNYFVDKVAPVSKEKSKLCYKVSVIVDTKDESKTTRIEIPVSTCCPCSLELCNNKAAHNQRGIITVKVRQELDDKRVLWFEDIIKSAEDAGSCEIYPVLRRPDEKYVTEKMFKQAKFVEDVVRDCVLNINKVINNVFVYVSCENHESIHAHSAYAETVKFLIGDKR